MIPDSPEAYQAELKEIAAQPASLDESITQAIANTHPRIYADDLSATVAQPTEISLKNTSRETHERIQTFARAAGLEMNAGKKFTYFGHKNVQDVFPFVSNHKDAFRLTGGVVYFKTKVGLS